FTEHTKAVSCVAVSPDGNSIVSGSLDNTIRVRQMQRRDKSLSASVSYPSSKVCPLCQKKVFLVNCERISTITLRTVKKARNGENIRKLLRMRRIARSKSKEFTVEKHVRVLCSNCNYAFPSCKIPETTRSKGILIPSRLAGLPSALII